MKSFVMLNNSTCIKYITAVFFVVTIFITPHISFSQTINDVTISVFFKEEPTINEAYITPLKYNKRFALSMQMDDGQDAIITEGYPVFNGGKIGSTTYPGYKYSDGCGNPINFRMTSAIYTFNTYDSSDAHTDPTTPIITWNELNTLVQSGWGVANHGVNTDAFTTPTFMDYSIGRNRSYVRRKMFNSMPGGVIPNVFVNPNGVLAYNTPALFLGSICALNPDPTGPLASDYGGDVNNQEFNWAVERYNLTRQNCAEKEINQIVDSINKWSVDGVNYWVPIYTHDFTATEYPFNKFISDFNYINSQYGLEGSDAILMTTDEEILDYLIIRDGTELISDLQGWELKISFDGNNPNNLLFYDLSMVVNSDVQIDSIAVNGVTEYTDSGLNDTTILINFSWDGKIIPSPYDEAEIFVEKAKATGKAEDALIAMDYVYTMDYGDEKDAMVQQLCAIEGVKYEDGFCESGYPNFVRITGDSSIIQGFEGTLYATEGLETYFWSTGEFATTTIKVKPETDTKYWVQATTKYGETVSDTILVVVEDSYIVDNSPLFVHHTPGTPEVLWVELVSGTTPLWDNGSTASSITVDPDETTFYTCSVLIDGDVVQALEFEVFVGNILSFTYDTVCLGDTSYFYNTTETSDTIVDILWDLNGDAIFDDGKGSTAKYFYENAGNHLAGMRVYFKNDPMEVVYNAVPVGFDPLADFDYQNNCLGFNTEFYDRSTVIDDSITKWDWNFGDGIHTDVFPNPTCLYAQAGTYDVKLIVWSSLGCTDTTQREVEIIEIGNIEIVTEKGDGVYNSDTVYFNKGNTISFTVVNYDSFDSVVWSNDDKAQVITIADTGSYRVSAYKESCDNSLRFYASWGSSPTPTPGDNIMNIFTPNGDGYNDYWLVNDPSMVFPIRLNIYTRGGQKVYENGNYDNTWDGKYNGNPLPQGAYYYLIEDSEDKKFRGSITIIR